MSMYGNADKPSSSYIDRQRIKAVAQLLKVVPAMYHIDEVFQWLASTIVEQYSVQLTQFWVNQADDAGQQAIQSRAMARQDSTILEQIVVNEDIAQVAYRIAGKRDIYIFQSVDGVDSQFSSYRARILKRYGLNYYAGCLVHQNVGLPPMRNATAHVQAATFSAIIALLFLKQAPHADLLPGISFIIDQAIGVAEKRGLLLPPAAITSTPRTPVSQPLSLRESPLLTELIPHRKDEGDFMLSNNPFTSSTVVIKDKLARRLYTAIDGQKNVAALCESTGMSIKDAYTALQALLSQKRVEIHEANGRLIDTDLFL